MSAVLIFIHTRAELVRIHRYKPRLSVSLTVRQLAQYTVTRWPSGTLVWQQFWVQTVKG